MGKMLARTILWLGWACAELLGWLQFRFLFTRFFLWSRHEEHDR
jgi:hypothetical protein